MTLTYLKNDIDLYKRYKYCLSLVVKYFYDNYVCFSPVSHVKSKETVSCYVILFYMKASKCTKTIESHLFPVRHTFHCLLFFIIKY